MRRAARAARTLRAEYSCRRQTRALGAATERRAGGGMPRAGTWAAANRTPVNATRRTEERSSREGAYRARRRRGLHQIGGHDIFQRRLDAS